MNLKKLFAVVAGVSLIAQTMLSMVPARAATFSAELEDAYAYAYEMGVTTMAPIENANMYGAITRAEMSKMIANRAEEVLGLKADTSASCVFNDTASVKGDLAGTIIKACQMGLMGQGITSFRPYDTVSRAEFGTILSRALWGDEHDGGTPYYAAHLNALKKAGIMTQIEDPVNRKEIRGYVMLMLMRADEDGVIGTPAICKDPMTLLLCAMDDEGCPAICKDKEEVGPDISVKSGDLAIVADASAMGKAIIGGVSDLDILTFKASERITLSKITLERYGFSSADDIEAVWLENDRGEVVTNERNVNNKDVVELTFKKDFRDMGKESTFVIVVQLKATAIKGTIGFKVTDVASSAKNLDIKKYTPNTYQMIEYDGSDVNLSDKATARSYSYNAGESYEVARLQARTSAVPIVVNGFTFTQCVGAKCMDLTKDVNVKKVEVLKDGTALKGVTFSATRDGLTVNLNKDTVEARKSALYVVKVTLEGMEKFGNIIQLGIEKAADFRAIESKTNARVSVSGAPFPGKEFTFNGDKITLTNGKLAGTVYGGQGSEGIVIAEGTIALQEPILLNGFTIEASDTGIDALKFVVGNDEYDAVRDATKKKFTFKSKDIYIEKSTDIKIVVDVVDDPAHLGKTISFSPASISRATLSDLAGNIGRYDEYNEKIAGTNLVGSITLSTLKVDTSKGSLTNTATRELEVKAAESVRVTLLDGEYSATKQNVRLNEFIVDYSTGLPRNSDDYVVFYLKIDGKEVATADIDGALITKASDMFDEILVKNGSKVNVTLEADLYLTQVSTTSHQFKLTLQGLDDNGNDAGKADNNTRKVKVVHEGSVIVSEDSTQRKDTVIKADSNIELVKFKLGAANNTTTATLSSLDFDIERLDIANTFNENDVVVKINGTSEDFTFDGVKNYALNGLNYDLKSTVTVEIWYEGELYSDKYEITLNDVNGTTQDKVYKRYAVPALVEFLKQESNDTFTKFNFTIDKSSSQTVQNLKLYTDLGVNLVGQLNGSFGESNSLQIMNLSAPKFVDKVTYEVKEGLTTVTVTIEKGVYEDYFKIGKDYAYVAKLP